MPKVGRYRALGQVTNNPASTDVPFVAVLAIDEGGGGRNIAKSRYMIEHAGEQTLHMMGEQWLTECAELQLDMYYESGNSQTIKGTNNETMLYISYEGR